MRARAAPAARAHCHADSNVTALMRTALLALFAGLGALVPVWTDPAAAQTAPLPGILSLPAIAPPPGTLRLTAQGAGSGESNCGAVASGFPRCPFDDAGMGVSLSLRQEAEFGSLETHGFFSRGSDGALAPWRQLIASNRPGMNEESTLAILGVRSRMLDGRLRLSASFGWADRWSTPLAEQTLLHRRLDEQAGSARKARIEFDLLDRKNLRWSLSGEASRASETFGYGQAAMLYRGDFFTPGKRTAISSALRLGQWRLTASADNHEASFGSASSRRIGIAAHGVSLALKARNSSVSPSMLVGGASSRTAGSNIYLDVDTAELFPELAFDRRGLRALLPTTLSASLTNSDTISDYSGTRRQYRRKGFELFGNWETPFGETSFGFSRDTRRGLAGPFLDSNERTLQASHMVRRGGWRIGVDGVLFESSTPGSGARDRTLMIGQTLAYSRIGGPEFMLRVGQDRIRSTARDGTYDSAIRASRITATLDLTQVMRRRLKRQDVGLKLEYRRRLDDGEYSYSSFDDVFERFTDSQQRQGLLLTFHMKLR